MTRRRGLNAEAVIDVAQAIADGTGLESLTIHGLAAQLKVRPPSIYNHVSGLGGVREGLHLRGLEGLSEVSQSAVEGKAGQEALTALAASIRQYAGEHPGLYAAAQPTVAPPETSRELRTAGAALLAIWTNVLEGFGLDGDDLIHGVRAFRAATHGWIQLERSGAFGMNVRAEESFALLIWTLGHGFTILANE